jgi:hypothetical protein
LAQAFVYFRHKLYFLGRNLPVGKERLARKADNLTAIFELIV